MPFDPDRLSNFPQKPGVYLMKDRRGHILYVGKAKNLRQRVKQYFSRKGDERIKIPYLMRHVEQVETILVHSDKEALLLENTLIKKHQPPYNALLKDDKTYIALKMTKERWPAVRLVRYKGRPKSDGIYFGPYTSAHSARATLDLINKIFPLRQCSNKEFARRTRPCILHGMGRCIAPCVDKCSEEEYQHHVQRTVQFLRGQDREVLKDLYREMEEASQAMEFERAGAILKTIRQVERTIEVQRVDKPLGTDIDAWGIYRQGDEVIVAEMIFRGGKLVGAQPFSFSNIVQEDPELLASFLLQQYERQEDRPAEVLVPCLLEDHEALSELLSEGSKHRVQIITPRKGEKKALVELAEKNAKAYFVQEKDEAVIREKTLLEIQEKFALAQYPRRIECFDNSHLSGSEPVSALVAFTDGIKETKRYRKYRVRATGAADDYGAFYEVLTRRLRRGKEENDLPDLLMVDGGKGQLNVALRVLQELNIISIDAIGFAKEEGRHDRGLASEKVFLPNRKDPLILPKTSKTLFFLQQIRDEAHRFTLSFQKLRRKKSILKTELEKIPTIGPAKQKALLRYFGSVKKIAEASEEEWAQVPGMHKKNILEMKRFFRQASF